MYYGLKNKKFSICKASAGSDKTVAYLLAVILIKKVFFGQDSVSGRPVTISTSSIKLEKKITEVEIPKLSSILVENGIIDKPIKAVLRKGKEHYFCYKRYLDFVNQKIFKPDQTQAIATMNYLKSNEFLKTAFDLDELNLRPYFKNRLSVKFDCKQCTYQSGCKYRNFIYELNNSTYDIQVTNHNQLLVDLKMKSKGIRGLLRVSDFIVIDEAHKLRFVAREVFDNKPLNKSFDEQLLNKNYLLISGIDIDKNKTIKSMSDYFHNIKPDSNFKNERKSDK